MTSCQLSWPLVLLFMQILLHGPLSQGEVRGKRCLLTLYPLQNWSKAGFGEGGFQLAGTFSLKMLKVSMLIHSESHSVSFFVIVFFVLFFVSWCTVSPPPLHTPAWLLTPVSLNVLPCCASCLCKVACLLCSYDSSVFALGVLSV